MVQAKLRAAGLLLDTDASVAATWQPVRDGLRQHLDVPEEYPSGGWVGYSDERRVGVYLVPGDGPGMMEDLLLRVAERGDAPLVGRARSAVGALEAPRFPPLRASKALLYTWLAWQEEPGTATGLAFRRGYLDPHAAELSSLHTWLRKLILPD